MSRSDVAVVGGGVVGCAVAWSLAREGRSVALFERHRVAAHASRVAAGMLVPCMEATDPDRAALGIRSFELYPAWIEELVARTGRDPGFRTPGSLRVARSSEDVETLRERALRFAARGASWLDADAVRAREPALAADVHGGLWNPGEGCVESGPLTHALAEAARGLGARILEGCTVHEVLRDGDRARGVRTDRGEWEADWVVVATGPWVGHRRGALGLPAPPPVAPQRGQILVLEPPRPAVSCVVSDGSVYLVPRRDGRLVVGATEERVGFDCRVTEEGVEALTAAATDLVPALAEARFREARAGLRPETPDGAPRIGPVPGVRGALWAVGHHRHGILLAPLTGRWVADRIAGEPLPDGARALDPPPARR